MPDFQPPIRDVRAGKDGSVWLTWSDDGSTEENRIILGPDLEPVGQLVLPRSTSFGWLTTDTVWLIEHDGSDVPWLGKHRLHGG